MTQSRETVEARPSGSLAVRTGAVRSATEGPGVLENPWGYGKRLRFVTGAIRATFPDRPPASIRVLDVGCGNGSLLALPLACHGFDLTGIDLDQTSIEHAQRLAEGIPSARFLVGALTELAEPCFDVVLLSEVLEHQVEPQTLLLASVQHLQPNGIVIVTVPNGRGEFEIDSWIFRSLGMSSIMNLFRNLLGRNGNSKRRSADHLDISATDNHDCGHVQFFSRDKLERLFAQSSLTIVREGAGTLMCGPIACSVLGRSRLFIEWNARVTDKLPLAFASSWYFVLRRDLHTGVSL